jgi:hypothetical protein
MQIPKKGFLLITMEMQTRSNRGRDPFQRSQLLNQEGWSINESEDRT